MNKIKEYLKHEEEAQSEDCIFQIQTSTGIEIARFTAKDFSKPRAIVVVYEYYLALYGARVNHTYIQAVIADMFEVTPKHLCVCVRNEQRQKSRAAKARDFHDMQKKDGNHA